MSDNSSPALNPSSALSEYPINDAAFDLISIIHEKSKALAAYETYLRDLQCDTHLRQILIEIKLDDRRHIEKLKGHLGRLLVELKDEDTKIA